MLYEVIHCLYPKCGSVIEVFRRLTQVRKCNLIIHLWWMRNRGEPQPNQKISGRVKYILRRNYCAPFYMAHEGYAYDY